MLRGKPQLACSAISSNRGQDHKHHGITLHKQPNDHLQPEYRASLVLDLGDNPQVRSLFMAPSMKQNPPFFNVTIKLDPMNN